MANTMGNGPYLEHLDWSKHKYLSKIFKNGKWQYIYPSNGALSKGIDKYITGSTAKKQMNFAKAMMKYESDPNMINTHKKVADAAEKEYQKSLAGKGTKAISAIKSSSAYSAGKRFLSSISNISLSSIRTSANALLKKASGWIDRNITGATSKRLANQYREDSRRAAERGDHASASTKANQAAALESAYNRSLFGRAATIGNKIGSAYNSYKQSKESSARAAAVSAKNARNSSYANAAEANKRLEFQSKIEAKQRKRAESHRNPNMNPYATMKSYDIKRKKQLTADKKKKAGGASSSRGFNRYGSAAY
ncbi:MAG: hypothetical protein KBT27_06575 [Prevotellaceae bacterium]|nr:hypothetical protein [Candidatus Faecinaster equi]